MDTKRLLDIVILDLETSKQTNYHELERIINSELNTDSKLVEIKKELKRLVMNESMIGKVLEFKMNDEDESKNNNKN